jgi:myo-inositol-1(or 4)-monophosphatase
MRLSSKIISYTNMLEEMKQIIREAGQIMLQARNIENGVESKEGRANFVTKYDVEVQNFLYQKLSQLLPEADFLGEENLQRKTSDSEFCFIIDPIDGTTNFIFDYKHSAISVALMHHNEIELGIVFNPYLDEIFYAEKGKGSYINGKRLQIKNTSLGDGIFAFGSAPYNPELSKESFTLAKKVFDHALDIRRTGSAALDICYVAANRFALYFEMILSPWDFSAASLILKEAGGVITTMENESLKFTSKCSVIAANPVSYKDFFNLNLE